MKDLLAVLTYCGCCSALLLGALLNPEANKGYIAMAAMFMTTIGLAMFIRRRG